MRGRYGYAPEHCQMIHYVKKKARAKQKLDFVSLSKVQLEAYRRKKINYKNSNHNFDIAWEFLLAFQQS